MNEFSCEVGRRQSATMRRPPADSLSVTRLPARSASQAMRWRAICEFSPNAAGAQLRYSMDIIMPDAAARPVSALRLGIARASVGSGGIV